MSSSTNESDKIKTKIEIVLASIKMWEANLNKNNGSFLSNAEKNLKIEQLRLQELKHKYPEYFYPGYCGLFGGLLLQFVLNEAGKSVSVKKYE